MTEAPRLYIFPHAGGSASFYVPFSKAFSTEMKRVAVQYPGAQGGHGQTAIPSIHELADNIYRILASAPESDGPVAFFGHSMGALVAFEVARRFESAGNPITALFVSACTAPARMRDEYFRDLSDDELVQVSRRPQRHRSKGVGQQGIRRHDPAGVARLLSRHCRLLVRGRSDGVLPDLCVHWDR